MKPLLISASDGYPVHAHLFEPEIGNGKLLLVNSATGVKQQVYFAFAQWLAEKGFVVITYDYRGIGLSKPEKMKGFKASMRTWGTQDYAAITRYIRKHFDDLVPFCLGHSVGALILGMNKDSAMFKKFVFVGAQDAYLRHLPYKVTFTAAIGFGIAVPVTNTFLGYFPAHWFGLGESLPKGSANDWRTLVLHKKSTARLLEKLGDNFAAALDQETVVLYAEDDPWVKMKGMESMMNSVYPNLKKSYREIKAVESPIGKIGHINFFRSYNKPLWEIVANELKTLG